MDTIKQQSSRLWKMILAVCLFLYPVITNATTAEAYQSYQYLGKIYDAQGQYGDATVGNFLVDGQQAFCLEHDKPTPPNGTSFAETIYDDERMLKALYYGYDGVEPWNGFKSTNNAIVVTSLALSVIYSGWDSIGGQNTGNRELGVNAFLDYIDSKSIPVREFSFSPSSVYATVQGDKQVTGDMTMNGDNSITITLPNNVTMIRNGQSLTGQVTINGGDTFHFEAPLTVTGTWDTGEVKGNLPDYQPIVLQSSSSNLQDIGYIRILTDPGFTGGFTVNWVDTGNLKITKQDNRGNLVSGVDFKLSYHSDMSSPIGTYTTGSDGTVTIPNLQAQTVYIQEVSVPSHLELDSTIHSITITAGGTTNFTQINDWKLGSVEIGKQDNYGNWVANTQFTLSYNADMSNPIGTYTTGADGKVVVRDLDPRTVYIQEVSVPDHLVLNSSIQSVEIPAGGTASFTQTNNWKQGQIQVVKYDAKTNQVVKQANVAFEIVKGGSVVETIYTNENGVAISGKLDYGTYMVREAQAPENYVITEVTADASISQDGQIIELTISNQPVTGSITLTKTDKETGSVVQGDATLAGAKYTLYAAEDIKDPASGSVLFPANSEVTISGQWGDNATKTFNGNDQVQWSNLPLGNYYVKETQAPEGYLLDETVYQVSLTYQDQETAHVSVHVDASDQVMKQAFSLIKISSDGSTGETETLAGAEFTVKLSSDVAANGWDAAATYDVLVTDEQGYDVSIELPYGTYTVRETKTPDEVSTVADFEVVINQDSREPLPYRVMNDGPFEAYVKIIKVDEETGKTVAIEGASFKIRDMATGELVSQKVGIFETIDTFTTDETGMVSTPLKLDAGSYQLEEIKAPEGYVLNKEVVPFEITNTGAFIMDEDGDAIVTVEMGDEAVVGHIKINKSGEVLVGYEDGQFIYEERGLKGAEYDIIAAEDIMDPSNDGTVIYEKGTVVEHLVTDARGDAISQFHPLGKYQVVETKAPYGYTLNTEPKDVTLAYEGQEVALVEESVSFVNERQQVQLDTIKVDVDNKEAVAGAEITLYAAKDIVNYEGEVIVEAGTALETVTTTADGSVQFDMDLPVIEATVTGNDDAIDPDFSQTVIDGYRIVGDVNGSFALVETKAPTGYASYPLAYLFDTVANSGEAVITFSYTFENEITKVEISKKDATTSEELPGAHLEVRDEEGNIVDEWISSNEPHIIEGLEVGKEYTLIETIHPLGFDFANEIKFVVGDTGEIQKVEMLDELKTGQVTVNKTGNLFNEVTEGESDFGTTHTPVFNEAGLEGVEFTIYAAEDITLGNGVTYFDKDEAIMTITTDADGKAVSDSLLVGKYYLKETTVPDGFVRNDTSYFFEIKDEDVQGVNVDMDVFNDRATVTLDLTKVMETNHYDYEEAYKDVIFGIFAREDILMADGSVGIAKDSLVYTSGIDEDGHLATAIELPLGDYYIKELKTNEAYELNETEYDFTIAYMGPLISAYTIQINRGLSIENDLIKTAVKVLKVDSETGEAILNENFEFTVYTDEACTDALMTVKADTETGTVTFNDLTFGTYYVKETKAPTGYQLSDEVKTIVIDENLEGVGDVYTFEYANTLIHTDIRVNKVDSQTNKTILHKDFEFTLYSDKACEEALMTASANTEEGSAVFEDLTYGTYYVKETKAPEGYQLSEEVKTIVINDDLEGVGDVHEFEYLNTLLPVEEGVQTGDNTNIALWAGLSIVSASAAAIMVARKKRREAE